MTTSISKMIKKLLVAVVGTAVVALGTSSKAQAVSLVATDTGEVGTIAPATGAVTNVFTISPTLLIGIAFSNSGNLFGATNADLYSINPSSHSSSLIGSFGKFTSLTAIGGADSSNILYGLDGGTGFYDINIQTGAALEIANIPNFSGEALVFDPSNNQILATSGIGSGGDTLYSIDPITGVANEIGNTGFNNVYGLIFDQGLLYGYTADKQEIAVDPNTGAGVLYKNVTGLTGTTLVGAANFQTVASIPEPSSVLGILTFGTIGVGVLAPKRKQ